MGWIKNLSSKFVKNYKINNNYRILPELTNIKPPYSLYNGKKIINWSNNDYNNIANNYDLKNILSNKEYGYVSSCNEKLDYFLEKKIRNLHDKESGLIFNSDYLANLCSIQAFGKIFNNGMIFTDNNHSSITNGIKLCELKKAVFKHNDMNHLEFLLKKNCSIKNKIIIIESMYSTDGSLPNFNDIIYLKKKYNCLLFVDEIHAVGVHGQKGGGINELLGITNDIDIIMGSFSKSYGLIGGYITGNKDLIDAIRLCSSEFICSTPLPPYIINSIIKSIDLNLKIIKNTQLERYEIIRIFNKIAKKNNIPLIKNYFLPSQIQFIDIGCPKISKNIHHILLNKYNHYIQPLNYPIVPKNKERIRISLKSCHTEEMINQLLNYIKHLLNDKI